MNKGPRSREPCDYLYVVQFMQLITVCNLLQRCVEIETSEPGLSWGKGGRDDVSWDFDKKRT